ncbi:MAG: hypothetical protein KKC68_02425 [Candidatus Thermoplasmatota archaeon]|nr:hypothetical protein [Candidatus Thermoplasmatota archaeon]MBU1940607.1 hypothetical protein [Candidatus Thermoplasmatota archaeon]
MKSKRIQILVLAGIIFLFLSTVAIPSSCRVTTTPIMQESFCEIARPIRALYLNDMEIWAFKLIQRGIVLGDITIEITAVDDTYGIEYVEISIDGQRKATIYDPPYSFTWDEWRPGFHILDAKAQNNNGTFINAESFQILKFG